MGGIIFDASDAPRLTHASIDFTTTGDNTVVSGTAQQTVRVYKIFFVVSDATDIVFKDGSTALTGAISMAAKGSFILDFDAEPWFATSAGSAFVINQSGTAQVSGRIYYLKN